MASVLLIDDDDDIRELVTLFLKYLNYDILEASDGKEGEIIALSKRPEIILVDLMMRIQDGYTTCANLRKQGFDGYILVVSAVFKADGKEKALACGADEYMQKPINPPALRTYLERALKDRSRHGNDKLAQ